MQKQNQALLAAHSLPAGEKEAKVAESFTAPKQLDTKDFRGWQEALCKAVVAGIPSRQGDVLKLWNASMVLFTEHDDVPIPERCYTVVAELADSGDLEEWVIEIGNGGFKSIAGTSHGRDITE